MTAPFMDLIKPHLTGAVESAIQQQLDLAVAYFLKQSLLWKQELGPYDVDGDEPTMSLSLTSPVRRVAFIHGVWFNGVKLRAVNDSKPLALWDTATKPTDFMAELPETLHLKPVPTEFYVDALIIDASVYPDSADDAPAWLGERFEEEIVSGTLARMMLQPDKPYTNTKMAQYHDIMFRNGYNSARRTAMATFQYGGQPWQYPYFAGRR